MSRNKKNKKRNVSKQIKTPLNGVLFLLLFY